MIKKATGHSPLTKLKGINIANSNNIQKLSIFYLKKDSTLVTEMLS